VYDQRTSYLNRIADAQREAAALSIQVKLDADESEDTLALAEAADKMSEAVQQLERAYDVLETGRARRAWALEPRDIYSAVSG
jgi:hypothetical protein